MENWYTENTGSTQMIFQLMFKVVIEYLLSINIQKKKFMLRYKFCFYYFMLISDLT